MDAKLHYFGPLLFEIKVSDQTLSNLRNICSRESPSVNRKLAGILKNQHEVDSYKYAGIMSEYFESFKHCYNHWYRKNVDFHVTSCWANYMEAGDSNPFHIHTGCDFSSVLFVDVPTGLEEEVKNYEGTSQGPGGLNFYYGTGAQYSINQQSFTPCVGSFYMFPFNLLHSVQPFKCDGVRLSIAANYNVVEGS